MTEQTTEQSTVVERAFSVIRAHRNTGNGVGPLRKWLNAIYTDPVWKGDLIEAIKTINKDTTLADKVSGMVERYTAAKGDPWKRNLGKQEQKGNGEETEKTKTEMKML